MVEKIVFYKIEGEVANTIRKVLANISDTSFRGDYGLSDEELSHIHQYLDNVDVEGEG